MLLLSTGCSIRKIVPDQKMLLVKNKVKADKNIPYAQEQIRHRPNSKVLGIARVRLHLFKIGKRSKLLPKKVKKRWVEKVGEAPVIIDSSYASNSAENLKTFLFNKGYLHSDVYYTVAPKRFNKRKGIVTYHVATDTVWKIAIYEFQSTQKDINDILVAQKKKAKVYKGLPLDLNKLSQERERISELLKNNGYFDFNKQFIEFQIDTSFGNHAANVNAIIKSKQDLEPHKTFDYGKIHVYINGVPTTYSEDSFLIHDGLHLRLNGYHIKPYVLKESIFLNTGDKTNLKKQQSTYNRLMALGVFKRINIGFERSDSSKTIDVNIVLSTRSKHEFIWEPQLISTEQNSGIVEDRSRNYGVGNNFILRNKNVFGNAEQINIISNTSFESQLKKDTLNAVSSIRQNLSVELIEPRLLFLSGLSQFMTIDRPRTKVNISYIFEDNANYKRNVFPLNFTYTFTKQEFNWYVTPIQVSYNRASVNQDFLNSLDEANLKYVEQVLRNNLILGPKLGFTYTDKAYKDDHNFRLAVNAIEVSGTTPGIANSIAGNSQTQRTILGVVYSQFSKTDIDAVFYEKVGHENLLVARVFSGIAFPFGNSSVVPFERRYFVGGNNSMRAWRPRSLGPGGYKKNSTGLAVDKTGEILIQANLEYRFNINSGMLKGAIFNDIGNIWLTRPDESFPLGEFDVNRFYKEFGWNTGLGLRLDLDFFIIRADWGIPIYDPALEDSWTINDFGQRGWVIDNTVLNIAVGYPF